MEICGFRDNCFFFFVSVYFAVILASLSRDRPICLAAMFELAMIQLLPCLFTDFLFLF